MQMIPMIFHLWLHCKKWSEEKSEETHAIKIIK